MNQKTKKIILLIFTILALLINISYVFAIYTGAINLEVAGNATQISKNSQLAILLMCALVNLISVIFISKSLITHKKKLIILNVAQLLFGTIFNIIVAIINIIILATKTKDVEEPPKVKKELPVLEDITKHKWYVYFIIFVLLFIICYTPFSNLIPIPNTRIATIIFMVLLYIVQITALVIPMLNELKRDFGVFKNNLKLYLSNILPRFGIVALGYLIANLFVLTLVGNIPNNQAILSSWPIYITAFLAIIVAPLTEELMFRGFIRKFIKNDILFVLISSIIFGALHITSADSLQQVLYIIPYSILGSAFSLNYVKTKNIASNIFLHSVWNTIATVFMFLLSL